MSDSSSQSVVRRLETKPRSSFVPFVLDVYDAAMPVGSPRVVARVDTRDGHVWRTKGSTVPMREIRAAIEGRKS